MLLYSRDHLWVRTDDGPATVGISEHAQEQLGDILYVELPQTGTVLQAGESFGVIESVKTASDLIAPVDGTVTEVNPVLGDEPWRVNDAPLGDGWLLRVECAPPVPGDYLMDEDTYRGMV